jgi:ribose 5-phosphate isomerase B
VLTLGARMIGEGLALEIVDTFLATPWGAERHGKRVAKITQIEQQYRTAKAEEPR